MRVAIHNADGGSFPNLALLKLASWHRTHGHTVEWFLPLMPYDRVYSSKVFSWTPTWEQVENHKGKEGYVNGASTTIKDYGPLPSGWSDTPPPPTAEELAERRRAEILARLNEIDTASVRPLRAIAQGDAGQADTDKLVALDAEAAALRAELAELEP